jgi:hypothetical protein
MTSGECFEHMCKWNMKYIGKYISAERLFLCKCSTWLNKKIVYTPDYVYITL